MESGGFARFESMVTNSLILHFTLSILHFAVAATIAAATAVAAAETRTSPVQMSVIRSMKVVYQNSPKTGRRGIATTLRQLDHDLDESVEGVDGIPVTN